MAVQTTYLDNLRPGVPGSLANMELSNLISRIVETEAGIAFGKPVARGVGDNGCVATDEDTDAILGITVLDRSVLQGNGFSHHEAARIATKGVVFVTASVAVVQGDPVFVEVATGNFVKAGGDGFVEIPNAVYDSSAAANGLVKVRLA